MTHAQPLPAPSLLARIRPRLPLRGLAMAALAATLALGGLSSPAPAMDSGELARTVMGVAAVGLLLDAAHKSGKDKTRARAPKHKTRPRAQSARVLPAACAQQTRTRAGHETVLRQSCLQREMRGSTRLPASCQVTLTRPGFKGHGTRRGRGASHDVAYRLGCLQRAGYRLGHRR